MLQLAYNDKYRLWSDLLRSSADRLFVASNELVEVGSQVSIEIRLPDHEAPIVIEGRAVGRRPESRRFQAGLYLRIPEHELEKCRQFLGLRRSGDADARARHTVRVHHETEVRFLDPVSDTACHTRNISETGLFIVGDLDLVAGQQVRLDLALNDERLRLDALVAWTAHGKNAAGLELIELRDEVATRLRDAIGLLTAAREDGDEPVGPRPVVVADDDEAILLLLNRALSGHGYDVYQAGDGDVAIELVRRLQPSLVVLDVLLPGVDGAHVCKTMRADAELTDIPVILVSALEPADLHAVADECGATDYLTKPLHLDELLDLLGTYLPT